MKSSHLLVEIQTEKVQSRFVQSHPLGFTESMSCRIACSTSRSEDFPFNLCQRMLRSVADGERVELWSIQPAFIDSE